MSRGACGLRYHGANVRFPATPLQGCRGCPLGALHEALVPAEVLTRKRTHSDRMRGTMFPRGRGPSPLWPDRVQR